MSQLESSSPVPRVVFRDLRLSTTATPLMTRRAFSSAPPKGGAYVAIDHSEAYEGAMQGPHGKQLALARLEGAGKDDLPFDPFSDELGELSAIDFEDDDDEDEMEDESVLEAELVEDEDDDDDEYEDDEEEGDLESLYNPDGSLRRKKSVMATLRAGFPSGGQFAVVELGGTQFKVTTEDVIVVNRLKPVEDYKIGSVHTLSDVMLVGSSHMTLVGVPYVTGAQVDVMVEEITRDAKVIIFKKRRRKNSQRKNGFRRDVTLLRVLDIRMPEEYRDHTHIGREIVDSLEEHFELQDSTVDEGSQKIAAEDAQMPPKLQSESAI
jgi:large subunit ribosomal protein L21